MEKIFLSAFRGFNEAEYASLRGLALIRKRSFPKGAVILHAGDVVSAFGLVCSGSVHIESYDLWGSRSVLSSVGPGEVFAESYALCRRAMMVDVVAAADADILFIDLRGALDPSHSTASWQQKLKNCLLEMAAQKNLILSNRIFCTASKTIRGRLLVYLSSQAAANGRDEFDIPFNRQQLADFLNVERSALSKELGKMKADGLIDCRKNHFVLMGKQ